jgi:glycosyltransferase involved in cell wall biosynthesis
MKFFYPKASGIVTVSNGAGNFLSQITGLKRELINVIYNPIVGKLENKKYEIPKEPKDWCIGNHKRILSVGALKEVKDFKTLLEAFALIHNEIDIRLLILGEGELRENLESLVKDLNIENKVFFPGFLKETYKYYQYADLFVLSSINEGLPTVLIEALYNGTPVVSTDSPTGPREILLDGALGKLVPVRNAKALAKSIKLSLLSDHNHNELKLRAQFFSIEKGIDNYISLLFPV